MPRKTNRVTSQAWLLQTKSLAHPELAGFLTSRCWVVRIGRPVGNHGATELHCNTSVPLDQAVSVPVEIPADATSVQLGFYLGSLWCGHDADEVPLLLAPEWRTTMTTRINGKDRVILKPVVLSHTLFPEYLVEGLENAKPESACRTVSDPSKW
jgi:hypothetical protein